ncbi:MAG: HAMP domain-containing histidine kinase, partial [Gammaproteobacteria bacterium]|nr:HAMP domain-containing histidine kinase [Gammaproteobacteria bacterium]
CGNILISLSKNENYSVITIEDNGSGIPLDVLSKLGELGVTYGKRNGLGLGLFHAKQTVEKWNGKIDIQSLIHKGTTVKIYLPVAQPPEWFISSIKIINDQDIIIIDDDASIHDVWIMRFNDFQGKFNMSVKLHHFYSPDEFSLWKSSRESNNSIIYLCDYEFIGSKENGVDLITKFQINYLSILVTSRVNSEELTSKCESSGIKLLPKDMASFIPIIPFPQ